MKKNKYKPCWKEMFSLEAKHHQDVIIVWDLSGLDELVLSRPQHHSVVSPPERLNVNRFVGLSVQMFFLLLSFPDFHLWRKAFVPEPVILRLKKIPRWKLPLDKSIERGVARQRCSKAPSLKLDVTSSSFNEALFGWLTDWLTDCSSLLITLMEKCCAIADCRQC